MLFIPEPVQSMVIATIGEWSATHEDYHQCLQVKSVLTLQRRRTHEHASMTSEDPPITSTSVCYGVVTKMRFRFSTLRDVAAPRPIFLIGPLDPANPSEH